MAWFKVDDQLHEHVKVRKAGKAAMGVWVLAGSWSMDNGTDGFIPADVMLRWGTRADAGRLVAAGFWYVDEQDGEQGWRFHDWHHFQPSAAVTAATKAAEAEAGRIGNHKRWHVKRGITDPDCDYCYRVPDGPPDRVPDALPESGGESGGNRPLPIPLPNTEPNGSARRTSHLESVPAADDASTLIAEWLERCGKRPPGDVIARIGKQLKAMLGEGMDVDDVRRGLAAWHRKNLNPSTLTSVVNEVMQQHHDPTQARTLPDGRILLPPLPKGVFDQ